jgi:hypothetical protein
MKPPKCKPNPLAARYRRKVVRTIVFDGQTLSVEIQGEGFVFARVVFRGTVGFRVLDEMNLNEFWPAFSEPNGWLYEVEEGGWKELESQRPAGSASFAVNPKLREYFLVDDRCISVFCAHAPEIVNFGADPQRT